MNDERRRDPPDDTEITDSTAAAGDTEALTSGMRTSDTIGPYRLLEPIGQGGMGEVWAAEQLQPVQRRVALKIIKRGMDTREVVARFEAERQALALMNHPNVARVFDAGQTPRGRPYFAMEYVKGRPITEYCDRSRLTTRERLELMIQVCEGVQHAHQKGIIHRDLKPSNILVSVETEGKPTPKIIDFGVAKATNQHLTESTLYTQMGQLIGTPEYMSPEQAEMTGEDVDTRTDVYSLGVVLYELLTGTLPLDGKQLRSAGLFEIQRRIRDEDPPRPSTRVSSLGEHSDEVAKRRRTVGATLVRGLKGDLDWIVMRALEKDRLRRYGSPTELAEDLRRHLNEEPVLAAPPSVGYRARKFVKRHRAGVIAAAALVLALVVGVAGLASGLLRARQAEDRALAERDRATELSGELAEVVQFMVNLFEVSDPTEGAGDDVTAREILDQGATRLRTELREQPVIRARLFDTLGQVYSSLGEYDEAAKQQNESLEILRREKGGESEEVAEALLGLAAIEFHRAQYEASDRAARSALDVFRRLRQGDHVDVSRATRSLALARAALGHYDEAEPLYREALEMVRRIPDADPKILEAQVRGLANVLGDIDGHEEEQEALYRESLDLCREIYGGDHVMVAYALDNLAIHYDFAGDRERAEPLYREALAMLRRVYDGDHPEVAQTMGNVAGFLVAWYDPDEEDSAADLDEAEALYRGAIEMHERYRPGHPMIGDGLTGLGNLEAERGDYAASVESYERGIEVYERNLDSTHPKVVWARVGLAGSLLDLGRAEEAEAMLRALYDSLDESSDEGLREDAVSLLVEAYEKLGKPGEATRFRAMLPQEGDQP